jgi:hypothetical protein
MPDITIELDGAASGSTGSALQAVIDQADDAQHTGPSGEDGIIVPVVLFLAIAITYCAKYFFTHRTRQEMQATVRVALERGTPLTAELLERLGEPAPAKRNDLRRGVIAVGLGLGLGAFGFMLGEPDAVRPMLAVGLVPLLLGLAYLVLWRLGGNR